MEPKSGTTHVYPLCIKENMPLWIQIRQTVWIDLLAKTYKLLLNPECNMQVWGTDPQLKLIGSIPLKSEKVLCFTPSSLLEEAKYVN